MTSASHLKFGDRIGTPVGVAFRRIRLAVVGLLLPLALIVPVAPVQASGTTYTVTTTDDTPTDTNCAVTCTLRQAVNASNVNDPGAGNQNTIQFASGVQGTITLVHGTLALSKSVAIIGPTGGGGVSVSGNDAVGVFAVNSGVTASISNLTIAHGAASFGGGVDNHGALTLANTTMSANAASNLGGAIYSDTPGTLILTNCTLSGNMAQSGGGISVYNDALTLMNVTVSGNTAQNGQGSGIFLGPPATGGVTLTNTIVAGNINTGMSSLSDINGTVASGSMNNLVGTGFGSGGLTNGTNGNKIGTTANPINPLLAPLGNYGGPTQTLAPLPGSPAIDAGTAGGAPTSDQRGVARAGAVDIGAVESQGFTLMKTSGDNQAVPPGSAFAPLIVTLSSGHNEPVQNGVVTFTGPPSGASIQSSPGAGVIAANGQASVTPTANGAVGGPYNVIATATGASPSVAFALTNAPTLTGISPNFGGSNGGNTVTLTGTNFGTAANTQVLVDGVAIPTASIESVTGTTIVFMTPAHSAGAAVITVRVMGVTAIGSSSYQYGQVQPLPPPHPSAAPTGPVLPLPAPRPTGVASGVPNPLPNPRP